MPVGLVRHPAALAVPAAAGVLAAALLSIVPIQLGISALAGTVVVCALVVWPWAALPAGIVGGALGAQALALEHVASVVAVHAALVAAGLLGVALRRALDPAWGGRVVTPADGPMVAFAVVIALGSAYGLALGNPADRVLVAAYQLAVVPIYFFLATLTLSTPRRLHAASVLFLVGAAGMALAGLGVEGRHGGLFSALALPGTLAAAAATTRTGPRLLLMGSAALFAIDVVLSAYRAVWLAASVALVLVLVTGTAPPFAPAGLCCPAHHRYYDPLRLPLDRPSLPGITGYRRASLPAARSGGAEEGLPSCRDNRLTVQRPLRRRVPRRPLPDPRRLPWPSPLQHRLGSLSRPPTRADPS